MATRGRSRGSRGGALALAIPVRGVGILRFTARAASARLAARGSGARSASRGTGAARGARTGARRAGARGAMPTAAATGGATARARAATRATVTRPRGGSVRRAAPAWAATPVSAEASMMLTAATAAAAGSIFVARAASMSARTAGSTEHPPPPFDRPPTKPQFPPSKHPAENFLHLHYCVFLTCEVTIQFHVARFVLQSGFRTSESYSVCSIRWVSRSIRSHPRCARSGSLVV